jgi:SHS2 domain-containing protein
MGYKYLEHTADVKFIAEGTTIEEAFLESVKALKDSICGDIKIIEQIEKEIRIKGRSLENLLYKFLEEFLVLLDSESFLLSSVSDLKIDKEGFILTAKAKGDNAENYHFTNDVKAVTYSQMEIQETKEGFSCTVVLDV